MQVQQATAVLTTRFALQQLADLCAASLDGHFVEDQPPNPAYSAFVCFFGARCSKVKMQPQQTAAPTNSPAAAPAPEVAAS